MQRRSKRLIKLIVLSIFVLSVLVYLFSWIRQQSFQRSYFKAFQAAHKELDVGESRTIVLKNTLGADICLISEGYLTENDIYLNVQDIVTNLKLAKRIAKKIPLYDGYYLILVKDRRVVYVRRLSGEYSALNVYDPNAKTYIRKGILASTVGKEIKFIAQKVENYQPLLITKIE